MIDSILQIPIEWRLLALLLLGALVGGVVNLGIYRLAWAPRDLSPWSRPENSHVRRRWSDYIPVFGWLGRARESDVYGRGFWIRPLLIEMGLGVLFAWLYWWELAELGLLTPPLQPGFPAPAGLLATVHLQFVSHLALITLMSVASWIDIDEKIIPDTVTIPGTIVGLLLAALLPLSLLPADVAPVPGVAGLWQVEPLSLVSPDVWPAALAGAPQTLSLLLALGCWLSWCFALLPRRWIGRRGLVWGWRFFIGRLRREPVTYQLIALAVAGALAVAAVWQWANAPAWQGLLTALVGMAAGGVVVWVVRIVGHLALRKEAMGFGDVTLLAMIGTYVGWQSCLVIFFLAPFAGLAIAVTQWLVHREHEIPYGPFLCLATLTLITFWAAIWDAVAPVFGAGLLVPAVVAGCMLLMGLMLGIWRLLRIAIWGG